jgi:hypothetical protein
MIRTQTHSHEALTFEEKPILVERYADNGQFSHWELVDIRTHKTIWTDSIDAKALPTPSTETPQANAINDYLKNHFGENPHKNSADDGAFMMWEAHLSDAAEHFKAGWEAREAQSSEPSLPNVYVDNFSLVIMELQQTIERCDLQIERGAYLYKHGFQLLKSQCVNAIKVLEEYTAPKENNDTNVRQDSSIVVSQAVHQQNLNQQ